MTKIPDIHIARHTAQSIWHGALLHAPQGFFGLLGETADDLIDQAVTSVTGEAEEGFLRKTVTQWQQQGIRLRGALYGSYDTSLFTTIEKAVRTTDATPLVHVVISLDTEGRLDSTAYILQGKEAIPAPLVMVEDGQPATIR